VLELVIVFASVSQLLSSFRRFFAVCRRFLVAPGLRP
jgi:hypothetical protein